MTAKPDWSDPWLFGGEFLFHSPEFLQQPLELWNLERYYQWGRDPDDDVSFREFVLRESPTARRSLRAFYASGNHPDRQPDELERRYLVLPDDGEPSWFAQPLPDPHFAQIPPGTRLFSEQTRERWRRKDEERAADRGITIEQLEEERAERRRQQKRKRARKERARAKELGISVAQLRRNQDEERSRSRARDQRLWSEWEARKEAIRAVSDPRADGEV